MALFNVALRFQDREQPLILNYKTHKDAEMAFKRLSHADPDPVWIELADDYGHRFFGPRDMIVAVYLADIEREMEVQIEVKMIEARANTDLQRRANSDAKLQLSARMNAPPPNGQMPLPRA